MIGRYDCVGIDFAISVMHLILVVIIHCLLMRTHKYCAQELAAVRAALEASLAEARGAAEAAAADAERREGAQAAAARKDAAAAHHAAAQRLDEMAASHAVALERAAAELAEARRGHAAAMESAAEEAQQQLQELRAAEARKLAKMKVGWPEPVALRPPPSLGRAGCGSF